jgi:hypothetical protein
MGVETLGVARSLGWKVHMQLRQRLSGGNEIDTKMRVSQAVGSRDAGQHARAQLPVIEARVAANVPGLRKSTGHGRVRTTEQSRSPQRVTRGLSWEQ